MSTKIVLSQEKKTAVAKIDDVVKGVLSFTTQNPFELMIVKAQAIAQIETLITPEILKDIVNLQGKKIGFLSDKVYSDTVVKSIFIEAVLTGLEPVGNHFNIIGGKMYIPKEGFGHLLAKLKCWYEIIPGLPYLENNSTIVDCKISWKKTGDTQISTKTVRFPVRKNDGMGNDGVIGKAERKARKWLYYEITGIELGDGDMSDDAVELNKTKPQEKTTPTNGVVDVNAHIPEAELVTEETETRRDIPEGMTKEEFTKLDAFIAGADTLDSLETRWNNIQKKYPTFPDTTYTETKQKLS